MTGAEFRRRDACQARGPWYRPPWVQAVGRSERSTSVARKGRRGGENERGEVERLGGSVRHHAQPSVRSLEPLSSPPLDPPRGVTHPTAHYHIFSFYILFRTALLLLSLSLFKLLPFCYSFRLLRPSWSLFFTARFAHGVSPLGHFIEQQRLRSFAYGFRRKILLKVLPHTHTKAEM